MTTVNRAQRLDALRRKSSTRVLIVGGGINGISTFRELAINGVDAVLIDRGDFMSGASSAPSRMIHGGLRYMENGEFTLVKESLRERNLLLANAPHLVTPLPTLIPITSRLSGICSAALRFIGINVAPGNRGALIVRLGLSFYDLYAGATAGMPRHRFFSKAETGRRWPELRPDVVCSAVYHDARISHPERLGMELVLESEATGDALALNHVGLVSLSDQGALLKDRLSGETFTLDAEIIVNAAGAWIDVTNSVMASKPPVLIGGTKGSHIVIANDRLRLALGDEMVYFANSEGRVCILFAHLGQVLAGSTDISVETPDDVRCTDAEVDYILTALREVFPSIAVARDEIIYRFAGVRPLPSSDGKVNANISRDHSCEWLDEAAEAPRPIINLVGGKWTTFRAFGETAADRVFERLDVRRRVSTEALAIGGGANYPKDEQGWIGAVARETRIDTDYLTLLFARYGTRASQLAERLAAGTAWLNALHHYSREEIVWLVETEHVATLADLVLRRMTIAFSGELALAVIVELAGICAVELGWDDDKRSAEVSGLLATLEQFHGLSVAQLSSRDSDWKDENVRRPQNSHEPTVRRRQVS